MSQTHHTCVERSVRKKCVASPLTAEKKVSQHTVQAEHTRKPEHHRCTPTQLFVAFSRDNPMF